MPSIRLPQVRLLPATNLNQDYQHSIVISVLRGLAAVEVAAAHLRAQFFPSLKSLAEPTLWYQALAFFTGFAHQAVVIFFLLSGWLVGGSLLNKLRQPQVMLNYTIDRCTRMWIVLVPALLLTLCLGAITGEVDPNRVSFSADNEYSVGSFFGNLFGLQDMAVPRYGGNFALWSLANEIWYYALFPLLLLSFAARTVTKKVAAAMICLVFAFVLLERIVLYFVIWLLGAGFSRVRINASHQGRLLLIVILAAVSVVFRLTGSNDVFERESFTQDLVFSLLFLTLLSSLQYRADQARLGTRIAKAVGTRLAAFSFTLYVIHVPLLLCFRQQFEQHARGSLSPEDPADLLVYVALCALIVFGAFLFHLPFEAQTHRVRAVIKRAIRASNARQPIVDA